METDLVTRIPEWEREAVKFEEKARALRQLIEAVQVLNGDAARLLSVRSLSGSNQYSNESGPRGRDAVRQITAERPGLWFIRDIKKINRERGWPSKDGSIETAVFRMSQKGEAHSAGKKGLYRFGAEAPDQTITDDEGAASVRQHASNAAA
jgi:hypothetical protein